MMSPGKKEEYLRYDPPPPPSASQFPWGLIKFILILLVLGGGAGAYYYYFVWLYRLPQEREIVLSGNVVNVQLEARNRELLKFTVLSDHSTHYLALASLPEDDRAFVLKLKEGLNLQFPLLLSMDQGGGKTVPVRLEGRSADWLEYTVLADSSTHFMPLAALKGDDQILVRELPEAINVTYPLLHTMTSVDGEELPERILGWSRDLVKLGYTDGSARYFPFDELSAVDQKLVKLLPENLNLSFPYECVLTDNNGQLHSVRVEGRAADIIKYTRLSDDEVDYTSLDNFCAADREVLHLFPAGSTFTLPIECTLTITKGKTQRVRVEGRSPTIVKYTLLDDGLDYYIALSSLPADEQKVLQATPATLRVRFPFKFALTLANGRLLDCTMVGRNNDSVKIMLADSKTYIYSLNQLSELNQAFLKLVPANLNDLSTSPNSGSSASANSSASSPQSVLNQMRIGLASFIAQNKVLLTTSNGQFNNGIDSNMTQIVELCKEANLQYDKLPKSAIAANVKSLWDSVQQMVQRDDRAEAELSTASTSERGALLNDRRTNRQELIAMLERIHAISGQYIP